MLKDDTYQNVPLVLTRRLLERINRAAIEARQNRSAFLRGIIEQALADQLGQHGQAEVLERAAGQGQGTY